MLFPWTSNEIIVVTGDQTDSIYKAPDGSTAYYQLDNPFNTPMQAVLAWYQAVDNIENFGMFHSIDVYASEGVIKLALRASGVPARVRIRISAFFEPV